ncbi:developmentally-regulated protein [Acrasis kona]|uniref:Developmentally-regulated protein n=1 Tax=Acrasis kona TaxID=1008807 RepID=A0AAW2ZA73_9EUKA
MFRQSIFKAGRSVVFNRTAPLFARSTKPLFQPITTPQVRNESNDLTISINFTVDESDLRHLIQELQIVGAKIIEKTPLTETYYDSVPPKYRVEAHAPQVFGSLPSKPNNFTPPTKQPGPNARVRKSRKDHIPEYVLSKKDTWLVQNDAGQWYMRAPAEDPAGKTHLDVARHLRIPVYKEFFGEREIRRELSLQQDETQEVLHGIPLMDLKSDLENRMNVIPFASYRVTRYKIKIPIVSEGLLREEGDNDDVIFPESPYLTRLYKQRDELQKKIEARLDKDGPDAQLERELENVERIIKNIEEKAIIKEERLEGGDEPSGVVEPEILDEREPEYVSGSDFVTDAAKQLDGPDSGEFQVIKAVDKSINDQKEANRQNLIHALSGDFGEASPGAVEELTKMSPNQLENYVKLKAESELTEGEALQQEGALSKKDRVVKSSSDSEEEQVGGPSSSDIDLDETTDENEERQDGLADEFVAPLDQAYMESNQIHETFGVDQWVDMTLDRTDFGYIFGTLTTNIENPDDQFGDVPQLFEIEKSLQLNTARQHAHIVEYILRNRPGHMRQLYAYGVAFRAREGSNKKYNEEADYGASDLDLEVTDSDADEEAVEEESESENSDNETADKRK